MNRLSISKVAVGCASVDALRRRQQARTAGGVVPVITRFRPKRADELVGGSIYWIVKHRIAARNTIIGFGEGEDRRTIIRLDSALVPVRVVARRAHQGWRYVAPGEAPPDFDDGDDDGIEYLPAALAMRLSSLALI